MIEKIASKIVHRDWNEVIELWVVRRNGAKFSLPSLFIGEYARGDRDEAIRKRKLEIASVILELAGG